MYFNIEHSLNGVSTIWMDQQNEKINKVSPELIGLFEGVVKELSENTNVKAIVVASRKKDFIAGADIEAFQKVEKPGDFEPITRMGHTILNAMEKSSKPIVAAIHGACLGAGLEIALACHARVCSDDRSTKMALPEVQLGLLPGGGGTQRLPRLIGLQKSLDMMLTAKNIFAIPALKMGLVDEVCPKEKLHTAASKLALSLIDKPKRRKRKKGWLEWFLDDTSIGRGIVFKKARQTVFRMTKGNYPAPMEIIACVEAGLKNGMEKGFNEEAKRFERLILSPQSRQLINIFFAMTDKKKHPNAELVRPVKRLGILGGGFMGAGIAEVSLQQGYEVVLKDLKEEVLGQAKKDIWKVLSKKISRKALSTMEAESQINRLKTTTTDAELTHCDVIIEAVFENVDLKRRVLADTEKATQPDTIFASNTSALPIKEIASQSAHPELVIGMHYFSPVPKMPLLEIVKTDKTADWVTATCLEIGIKQGKTCIVVNDGPGFYTTRILAPLLNEALLLLEDGATIEQIDKAMTAWGFPVGPVTLMDEVGIDVGAHIMKGDLIRHFIAQRGEGMRISQAMMKMAESGYAGRKNGKGFFRYDPKTGKKVRGKVNEQAYDFFGGKSTRKSLSDEQIQKRCSLIMVNEALQCLEEGIISCPLDGDIGAVFGLGFAPFRGGPFRYCDAEGRQTILAEMEALQKTEGDRFRHSKLLREEGAFYA